MDNREINMLDANSKVDSKLASEVKPSNATIEQTQKMQNAKQNKKTNSTYIVQDI
jgi:hypothetical protein